MSFESCNNNMTDEELHAWTRRMWSAGYMDAAEIARVMRITRDCRNIKDPLKIARRYHLAVRYSSEIASRAQSHPDTAYASGMARMEANILSGAKEQFRMCLRVFREERVAMLRRTKSVSRQYSITVKTQDRLTELESGMRKDMEYTRQPCDWAMEMIAEEADHWVDQARALNIR